MELSPGVQVRFQSTNPVVMKACLAYRGNELWTMSAAETPPAAALRDPLGPPICSEC